MMLQLVMLEFNAIKEIDHSWKRIEESCLQIVKLFKNSTFCDFYFCWWVRMEKHITQFEKNPTYLNLKFSSFHLTRPARKQFISRSVARVAPITYYFSLMITLSSFWVNLFLVNSTRTGSNYLTNIMFGRTAYICMSDELSVHTPHSLFFFSLFIARR